MSRNMKLQYHEQVRFAEVLYFTRLSVQADFDDEHDWHWQDVAVVQLYSHPDADLLRLSSHTVVSCSKLEEICVIDAKQVLSVVAMIPHNPRLPAGVMEEEERFFMLEKPGLDLLNVGITNNVLDDDDDGADVE
ncbi:hypothetical protein F4604DRAFT_1919970 [Suillus subluteus]|nr:hypothetical protein F4604DRAFT_1919970 [Suillus subluteus]